jgi:hypothetical protein
MPRWLILTLLLLCGALWWVAHRNSAPLAATTSGGNAALAACRVLQSPASVEGALQTGQAGPAFRAGNATLTPLAGFSIVARVLSREDYRFGRESQFSPTDLALGWGPMAAPGLAEQLDISQGGRWYRYRWDARGPPLAPALIAANSANMHMVPADAAAASALGRVRAGEMLRLDGWLLRIDADDGWHWQSSMSRDDAGAGACELVLVCSVRAR